MIRGSRVFSVRTTADLVAQAVSTRRAAALARHRLRADRVGRVARRAVRHALVHRGAAHARDGRAPRARRHRRSDLARLVVGRGLQLVVAAGLPSAWPAGSRLRGVDDAQLVGDQRHRTFPVLAGAAWRCRGGARRLPGAGRPRAARSIRSRRCAPS